METLLEIFRSICPKRRVLDVTNDLTCIESIGECVLRSTRNPQIILIAKRTCLSHRLFDYSKMFPHSSFYPDVLVMRNGSEVYLSSAEIPSKRAMQAFIHRGTKCRRCCQTSVPNFFCVECGTSLCVQCFKQIRVDFTNPNPLPCPSCATPLAKSLIPKRPPHVLILDPSWRPDSEAEKLRFEITGQMLGLLQDVILDIHLFRRAEGRSFSVQLEGIPDYFRYPVKEHPYWKNKVNPVRTIDLSKFHTILSATGERVVNASAWASIEAMQATKKKLITVALRDGKMKTTTLFWVHAVTQTQLIVGCELVCYTCQKSCMGRLCKDCGMIRFCSRSCEDQAHKELGGCLRTVPLKPAFSSIGEPFQVVGTRTGSHSWKDVLLKVSS